MRANHSDAFVFFGASGDFAYKQIFPALQALIRRGGFEVPIIGVAKSNWKLDQLRGRARESLQHHGGEDEAVFAKLSAQLRYVDGDYRDRSTYERLRQALGNAHQPLHYLAISPSIFAHVAASLAESGCATDARVVVEKPFGRDLATAQTLDRTLHEHFPESAIFRIDTISEKSRCRTCSTFALRTRFLSRSGTTSISAPHATSSSTKSSRF
jgi:glucose-6-phosphate 1-dehydrogenase